MWDTSQRGFLVVYYFDLPRYYCPHSTEEETEAERRSLSRHWDKPYIDKECTVQNVFIWMKNFITFFLSDQCITHRWFLLYFCATKDPLRFTQIEGTVSFKAVFMSLPITEVACSLYMTVFIAPTYPDCRTHCSGTLQVYSVAQKQSEPHPT